MFKNINLMLNENEGIVNFIFGTIALFALGFIIGMQAFEMCQFEYEGPSNLTVMVEECEADVEELEESIYKLNEVYYANA